MISSQILSSGDQQQSVSMKSSNTAEEFFFQSHPFSDLILLVQDKQLYVDKSVLAIGSKVFHKYIQDETINSIEIIDVSPNEMIELLRFLYPQFHCTINNQNVTILLILAYRFEIDFLSSACRTFILFYLSKIEIINMYKNRNNKLIKQEDGTCLSISSIIDILCIWFREFLYINDTICCEAILNKISYCNISSIIQSNDFKNLEDNIKWRIFQVRAKYLENQYLSIV
ncbi:unnamed protein product [Adineta steineri]|uniref:BTB domain-containing protein n=1 Tax=Adineta steineri TaxID=433720 RepID=A0A814EFJ8_9BILA|nr:unnamed protein product [Adineta steineri]CAF3527106.1 unnamed protein product [Adineta steineri]